jgi:HK97 family phage prohead protease
VELEIRDLPLHQVSIRAKGGGDAPHTLEGYAATFGGSPNSFNEIVAKGAFVESLRTRTPHFLWQHYADTPIAKTLSLAEDDHGLFGTWQLASTDAARNAYALISEGLVEGLSIGFITREDTYDENGVRVIKRADLYEVSAVTMPSQEAATITAVRANVPITTLLGQAGEVFRTVAREAKALRERRANDLPPRKLNDQQLRAVADYLREAEALAAELSALVVVEPEAKAPDFGEIGLQLAERRLRLGRHRLKESA